MKAYTLIECVLYITLLNIASWIVYGLIISCKQTEIKSTKSSQAIMEQSLLVDVIRRDLCNVTNFEYQGSDCYFHKCFINNQNKPAIELVSWQQHAQGIQRIVFKKGKNVQLYQTKMRNFRCIPSYEQKTLLKILISYQINNVCYEEYICMRYII